MTRINVVHPSELVDKHLLAEYRELPRVFALAHSWYMQGGNVNKLPPTYRLGRGHVMFFYDKLLYCRKRHEMIVNEMKRRGFKVTYPNAPLILRNELAGDWLPTSNCLRINRARIEERLKQMQERSRTRYARSS